MTNEEPFGNDSLLDEWLTSSGEATVISTIEGEHEKISTGSTPGFTDKLAFLAYIRSHRRRSA